jgi:uncharacterized membrane protein required for colicin V production
MEFPEQLYTIDIFFLAFVLLFVFSGIRHGLSGELAHVLTLLALLAGICFFYPQLIDLASGYWQALPENVVRNVVPLLMVLGAILLFFLVRAMCKQLLKKRMSEASDKAAGGVIGILRGTLLGLVVLAGISLIPNETLYRVLSEKSLIGAWVCNTLTPWAQPRIMELPVLKDNVSERIEELTQ